MSLNTAQAYASFIATFPEASLKCDQRKVDDFVSSHSGLSVLGHKLSPVLQDCYTQCRLVLSSTHLTQEADRIIARYAAVCGGGIDVMIPSSVNATEVAVAGALFPLFSNEEPLSVKLSKRAPWPWGHKSYVSNSCHEVGIKFGSVYSRERDLELLYRTSYFASVLAARWYVIARIRSTVTGACTFMVGLDSVDLAIAKARGSANRAAMAKVS